MKRIHLAAFTLFEMMITMILSSIIVFASLKLYLNYESLVRLKNRQMNSGKEMLQFYHIFKHEFDHSIQVESSGNEVTLLLAERNIVHYEFDKNYIVRNNQNLSDTFFIRVGRLEVLSDDVTGLKKEVNIELSNGGELYPVRLIKQYSNDVLMNLNVK